MMWRAAAVFHTERPRGWTRTGRGGRVAVAVRGEAGAPAETSTPCALLAVEATKCAR